MKNQENKTEQLKEMMYQDSLIHFALNPLSKNVMVNATEMAKIFGREMKDFNKLESTKSFIDSCLISEDSSLIGIKKREDLIVSRKNSGTWMHRLLAIKFAAWLDPIFEIWVFATIDNLLFGKIDQVKNSMTEIQLAEDKLKEAIESAKKSGNEEALAIIDALNAHESAKKKKDKAMRMFTRQMKMDL